MKKFFKTLVMAVLCLALVLPMAPFVGEEVQAAAVVDGPGLGIRFRRQDGRDFFPLNTYTAEELLLGVDDMDIFDDQVVHVVASPPFSLSSLHRR